MSQLVLVAVACCFLSQSAAEAQVKEIRRVLIINALGPTYPATARVDEAIRAVLEKSPYQIELYHEFLETVLFPEPATQQKFRESYIEKYRNRKPDLIIADGLSAIRFMSESDERFFRDTPVVFCGGIEQLADNLKLDSQFAGAWMVPQHVKTLEAALQLRPGTRHVVVVGGMGKMDRLGEALVREQLRSYEARLEFTYLTDLTMPVLLEQLKRLPSKTIIFYTAFSQDAAGAHFVDATQSIPMITAAANAPVFVNSDTLIGQGAVGGYVISFAAQGQDAGEIASRILNGERPQDIPIVRGDNLYMFDWRALHRWGIKERDLPVGSTVLYRVPTFWNLYRWRVGFNLLLLVGLALLSGYLLFERRQRKRAEESLVRQLRFETLISEISAEFINLPLTRIETGIRRNLARVREILEIERMSIFAYTDEDACFRLRHSARADGTAAAPDVLRKEDFPWLFAQLVGARHLVRLRLEDVPSDAKLEGELFQQSNPGLTVISPLTVEECLVGILSFAVNQAASFWPGDLQAQLRTVSQLFANAFARELAQKTLLESETRFRVMGDASPAFIWMSDQKGNVTYLNKTTLDFTGARAEDLNGNGWSAYIHPDDLRSALEASERAQQHRRKFIREYRIRRHDGVYRWMLDIGNSRFNAEGLFLGFIGSAVDITDQKLAREALEKVGGQLIAAQEKERSHLARELHDDICQRLAMLSLRIEKATNGANVGKAQRDEQMKEIWKQCSGIAGSVQALSHKLHSSILDNLGLVTAVKSFCREFSEHTGAVVEFIHKNIPDSLPREVSLSLFRVVQETLHNAAKYSGVMQFEVNLQEKSAGIELEVSDRGLGFDVASVKSTGGLGLVSMRERINLVNGTISIESKPNAGTRIHAWVPLASAARARSAHGTELWR